jgi:hypothetical protein
MADISLVTGVGGDRIESIALAAERPIPRNIPTSGQLGRAPERPSDRVDFSDRARFLSKLASLPDIRTELVGNIREQIAADTYDTEERLDEALAGLLDDLNLPG